MNTEINNEGLGVVGTLIGVLLGAFLGSATFFIIGYVFDSEVFINLGKIGAICGGALVFFNK